VTLDRVTTKDPPTDTVPVSTCEIIRDDWLGELLKSYRRAA
jgi:hypothetical protein